MNFYGVLVLVCILGLGSVAWARHDYQQPARTLPAPFVVALGISTCGTQVPSLEPNPISAPTGYVMLPDGVLVVAPKTFTEADATPLLSSFVDSYVGLQVTSKELVVPIGTKGRASKHTTGEVCAKGTKDAGKAGHVEIATWTNLVSERPALVTTNPAKVKLTSGLLVTIGFVPDGVTPPKPPATVIAAMESQKTAIAATGSTSTTTTTLKLTPPPTSSTTIKKSHKG